MQYEHQHSRENNYFYLSEKSTDRFCFPLHFHKSFELLFVEAGEEILQIDSIDFTVTAGQCALILPGQFHAYRTEQSAAIYIGIFSTDFLPELVHHVKEKHPHHPVFPLEKSAFLALFRQQERIFSLKSTLYALADRYVSGAPFTAFKAERDHLLYDIVRFISEHFNEPLSLKELADHFGYNYRYMSGIINRCFHLSFSEVLRRYRIDHACRLLKESGDSITYVSTLCGFDTTRSFNRNFKDVMGMTPKEYRDHTPPLTLDQ